MSQLSVVNSSGGGFEFTPNHAGTGGGVLEYINRVSGTTNPDLNFYLSGNANHKFYTGGTEKMRISGAGNVGVGTILPPARLSVAGTGGLA